MRTQEIFDTLESLVKASKPFSLLRFGDGEGLFAFYYRNMSNRYIQACHKHWGEVPAHNDRVLIARNIQYAYANCDIAALPYNFEGMWWQLAVNNFLHYDKVHHLNKETCGLNIHIELDRSGLLNRLISGKEVVFVGCREVRDILLEKKAVSVVHVPISAQYKFEENKPVVPFYKQVKEISEVIKRTDVSGKICLLAVGVAGKQLGIEMKQRGGMVIDIGSVADEWVGVKSRSWIK